MSYNDDQPCLKGPHVLLEQFIPDHVFIYVTQGTVNCYDGSRSYRFMAGDYFIARKNRLAKYFSEKGVKFERLMFCFEETFLRDFQQKHQVSSAKFNSAETFLILTPTEMIADFIRSLRAYSDTSGKINRAFENMKYEELLHIQLKSQPELAGLFFDFAPPEKINLEEFMNRNFAFNVRLDRFAFMTGRSLSAFKRDFKTIFNDTPNHWLVKKRLQEAYFLIDKQNKRASEIYLDLGFEDLSHFSLAFKKLFGFRPTAIAKRENHIKNTI
jgi:AraC-like DNA-binding protein